MTAADLKKFVDTKNLIIGTDQTMNALKNAELKKVFLASNCAETTRKTITTQAKILGVEVSELDITQEELGVLVKKPFTVSVVSVSK